MYDKKKVNVFEIEYETNEMNWKVKIAAWSKEDAFGYLNKMLKKTNYKIVGFTSISSIDAITTQVTDDIIKANTVGTVMSETQKMGTKKSSNDESEIKTEDLDLKDEKKKPGPKPNTMKKK